jgi:hypothetical protein
MNSRLAERQPEEELPGPVVLAERRHQRAGNPGDRGQRDHEQVEAADAELVADAELWNPLVVGHVLQAAAGVEVDQQRDRVEQHGD